MAKLYFRYGAMNCGKSTNLMQVAFNYEERGMRSLVIKPHTDTKGGGNVISRLGIKREVDMYLKGDKDVYREVEKWIEKNGSINCLLIDEVQFFKTDQIDQMLQIAVLMNIPVICYGLRTDFKMNGFEGSKRLLLIAHSIEELKTICRCGRKATLNGRKINGEFIFEGEQVVIDDGSEVEYESLCPKCYYDYKYKANK